MKNITNILIIGASSAIAYEVARICALNNCSITLLARNVDKLKAMEADLIARGAGSVHLHTGDLSDNANIENLFSIATKTTPAFDVIFIAYGILGNQLDSQNSREKLETVLNTNFISTAIWCEQAASYLEKNKKGCLAVIGSVAGDRGRKSNYIYGAAKGALDIYLAGMRHRFANSDINILTIKPGFVDTPMTDSFNKTGPLWASPTKVAGDIIIAIEENKSVLYTPWFWRYIMLIIKYLPNAIFKRSNL